MAKSYKPDVFYDNPYDAFLAKARIPACLHLPFVLLLSIGAFLYLIATVIGVLVFCLFALTILAFIFLPIINALLYAITGLSFL